MEEKIKIVKELPFKEVNPSKFMGINNKLPFNSIISESKLLYFSGRSLILENIKTYEQKIIWTNEYENSPEMIEHIRNTHRENIVGIAVCDNSENHAVIILHINSVINNYEHLSVKEKSKDKLHYLKDIDHDESIFKFRFLQDGGMFAVVIAQKGMEKQLSKKNINIYSSINGDCIYKCEHLARNPLIEAILLNRQRYACIIKNESEKPYEKENNGFEESFSRNRLTYNSEEISQFNFTINLLNLTDTSNKHSFFIKLKQGESVTEVKFVLNHKKILAFFLLNSGFIIAFMVNERGFHEEIRIDVRINKIEHQKKVEEKINKNNFSSKKCKETNHVSISHEENHEEESKAEKKPKIKVKRSHSNEYGEKSNIRSNNFTKDCQKRKDTDNLKINISEHYMPSCMSLTSSKVIIGFEDCPFIGLIQYSEVDHRQCKFWYIDDFFNNRSEINSIRKICFSEDGCHCSVLVKVKSVTNDECKKVSKTSSKAKFEKGECCGQEITEEPCLEEFFNLLQIDFVSGLIEHSYHTESIQESLACCSLDGNVDFVEFSFKNNTMFLLMEDNRLIYCNMNINKLSQSNQNGKQNLFTSANGNTSVKNQSSKLSLNNFLSESMLLWAKKIRIKPCIIISHPIVFEVVLVYQDSIKFHYHNYNKLFEYHHAISIKNCKAASYSPFGDKLALGTIGSIWVMDSYTYAIAKKISLVIFPTEVINKLPQEKQEKKPLKRPPSVFSSPSAKTVSKIQYINNYDIMIQTGNTTLSILLNYEKILFFGYTPQTIQGGLFCYDNKHHLGVTASEDCVKVITKCSINSKNKCEELAKIEICITSMKLCGEIDILFLGGKNGVLYFVRWPDFFQNEAVKYPTLNNKLYLFHSAIVDIQISVNFKQLFVTSEEGMIIICDLIHSDDVEKIGKDVSYRMSKKLDFKLPFINKWLVSISDGEQGAQNMTKLMGNEAEIKINENTFTEEYKKKLEIEFDKEKQRLNDKLKDEMAKYEEYTGISKLQLNIALAWDELKSIRGKREAESKEINEKIDAELHKIFLEKEKLEHELKEYKIKIEQEKKQFLEDEQNNFYLEDQNRENYIFEVKNMEKETEKFYNEKMTIDVAIQENMKEDFEDEFNEAKIFYDTELKSSNEKSNFLGQENRRITIEMMEMKEKMREFTARMEEVEDDVTLVEAERDKMDKIKCELSEQIAETDKKYHQLIKITKELETKLNRTRTESESRQLRYDELEKDMEILEDKWAYLEEKTEENNNNFVYQHNFRNANITQEQELKEKIVKIKQKRKEIFDNNVLLKDLLREFEKEDSEEKEDLNPYNNKSLEFKKGRAIKLTSDVDKWTNFKDESKGRMVHHIEKLQEQTSNLLFRFNELLKEHKDLINIQNDLKHSIKSQKQKINYNMTNTKWEKISFVPLPEEQPEEKTNFRNYVSINRKSLTKDDKFNSTSCHFSSSHSVARNINQNRLIDKPLVFLKQKFQDSKVNALETKLNKSSSKNLQSLIYEKKATLKQLKRNSSNHSDYHGVTLDPKTLKPNKTLCLSLHKEGSETKFVTEY